METTVTNESLLTDILGYKPSRGQILEILNAVKDTGRSIIEVAQDRGAPQILLKQNGKLNSNGRLYDSLEEYRKERPYRRLVILNTPDNK